MNNSTRQKQRNEASGPLAGVRVVDLADDHAGAVVAVFLSDYGAEVVKPTPPGGYPLQSSAAYAIWDRGKRIRPLDCLSGIATAMSCAALRTLVSGADIVIAAGQMRPLGDESMAADPRLIWLEITPYGSGRPERSEWAGEGLIAAETGVLTEQWTGEGAPFWNALPLVGYGTAMLGIIGVLAALHRREVTGRGQRVESSMVQGSLAARAPMLVRGEGVQTWDSAGNDLQGALPNYRLYECADGRWLHIGALLPDFWNKLAIAGEMLDLVTDPRFETAPLYWPDEETRAAAKSIIAGRMKLRPRDEWLRVLRDGDVPVAPALVTAELIDDAQVVANEYQAKTGTGGPRDASCVQLSWPVALHGTPSPLPPPSPIEEDDLDGWVSEPLPIRPGEKPPASSAEFHGPLSGVRVLDLSSYLAGPIGPAHLADLGADVIKVEPAGGEGCRMIMMLYLGGNTGKRDIGIDAKAPESSAVMERLIRWADIVVHNYRPGVAERLGIDYGTVRSLNPDVIYLHTTAFGSRGEQASRPGFDPLAQSLTGISQAQGGPGKPPVFPKTPICDIATAMLGAAGVLMGLFHRDRTGEGQSMENSLLSTGLWLKSDSFVRMPGYEPPRMTNGDNTGLNAAHRSYNASDGWLFIGARTDEHVALLGEVLGVEEITARSAGGLSDAALGAQIARIVTGDTAANWTARLTAAGVPACVVAVGIEEGVYANPDVLRLDGVAEAQYPGFTRLRQPGVLIGFNESPGERRRGSPACGQDSREILESLGFDPDQVASLIECGVVTAIGGAVAG